MEDTAMTTHAQMAAKLLSESAKFYRAVGQDNPQLKDNMESMASACETIAGLVEQDPTGELSLDSFKESDGAA
jgi:hypothetical protein